MTVEEINQRRDAHAVSASAASAGFDSKPPGPRYAALAAAGANNVARGMTGVSTQNARDAVTAAGAGMGNYTDVQIAIRERRWQLVQIITIPIGGDDRGPPQTQETQER